jgi:1,4-alpha-glucan branching enzyme
LNGFTNAKKVVLSGNFNNWRTDELVMMKTNDGWQFPYTLGPGNYEYKFIVDGNWITDPGNPVIVTGDHDSKNSFLIVEPNYTFRLKGFASAKNVFIAGDFNNWSGTALKMTKDGDDWVFKIHLRPGKHRYKFVVDGKWIVDPNNKLWEQNEFKTGNSVIWIE